MTSTASMLGSDHWEHIFARRTHASEGAITAILALAGATDVITFSGGFPAPETFPVTKLPGICDDLFGTGSAVALQYAPTPGLPGFREVLSERLALTDGRRPRDDELLVTSGGIDAMALIGRALLDQGDLVAVESPTYLGAITGFRSYEADVVEVPMDGEGMDVAALEALVAGGHQPKLIYTIPDHQNPTGLSLSLERRQGLVESCRRHGILIVEDVAYRELGADGSLPPSLWSLGPDTVVQIGTFSKTLFPGVRLGWAVGPASVVEQLITAKQNSDQCAGALGQRIAEEYLRSGGFDEQLPRSRALYAERRQVTLAALAEYLPPAFSWTRPEGGFYSWVSGPEGLDTTNLYPRAEAAGVAYVPGAPFYASAGRGTHQLRLSYSCAAPERITEGIRRLCSVLTSAGEEA